MITVKKCCCCISLKNGTIIIGVLELIKALLSLAAIFILPKWLSSDLLLIIKIFAAAVVIVWIVASSLLLAGIVRNRPRFVLTYLVIMVILLLIVLALNTALFVCYLLKSEILDSILLFFQVTIEIVIQTYLWIVVYSFYKAQNSNLT